MAVLVLANVLTRKRHHGSNRRQVASTNAKRKLQSGTISRFFLVHRYHFRAHLNSPRLNLLSKTRREVLDPQTHPNLLSQQGILVKTHKLLQDLTTDQVDVRFDRLDVAQKLVPEVCAGL